MKLVLQLQWRGQKMAATFMPVEVLILDGKGNIQVTGQIGEVMQESAQAAMSYVKSRVKQFDIDPEIFEAIDVHIHIPEGGIPKDGPSAGITIATALIFSVYKPEGAQRGFFYR